MIQKELVINETLHSLMELCQLCALLHPGCRRDLLFGSLGFVQRCVQAKIAIDSKLRLAPQREFNLIL